MPIRNDATLKQLLDPASIAIVGASDNPDKIGGRPIHYMRRHGYAGRLFPINPQRAEVQGERCWPALKDLPATPELAIVAVAGERFQPVECEQPVLLEHRRDSGETSGQLRQRDVGRSVFGRRMRRHQQMGLADAGGSGQQPRAMSFADAVVQHAGGGADEGVEAPVGAGRQRQRQLEAMSAHVTRGCRCRSGLRRGCRAR